MTPHVGDEFVETKPSTTGSDATSGKVCKTQATPNGG